MERAGSHEPALCHVRAAAKSGTPFVHGRVAGIDFGEALIREYYDIAPGIVTCINLASDRRETYRAIRETWLTPCYDDLQNGRLADCKDRYTQMVRTLEKRFLS